MIEWLEKIDRELFLFLNSLNTPWLDPVMKAISGTWWWVPFYLFLIYLLFRQYGYRAFWLLLALAIGITLSDQLTSGFMKPFFERLRPSRDPNLAGLVHLVDGYRGGMYGFASSHASNTFFVATFLYCLWRRIYPLSVWLFAWSTLVSYSRIYLGVHFPLDILTGAIIGILIGLIIHMILQRVNVLKSQIPSNN